jgi:hypothetical protein
MDQGGYLAFGKGQDAIFLVSATTSTGNQIGEARVRYRGVFNLDATSDVTQKPVLFLKEAQYAQIGFAAMAEKMEVLGGKAIVTINSAIRVEFPVPQQKMPKNFITVPDIQKYLTDFKE